MGNLIKWANKRMAYLSIWDIAGLKWGCMTFGIMIASIFPETLTQILRWPFWLVLTAVFLYKPIKSFYFRDKKIKR
jgi:hypothetical protein